jgi:hypothetical protein
MKPSRLAIGLLAAFFVAQFAMSRFVVYDKWKANYMPKSVGIQATGLDPGQFLAAMAGFREMIAGILWVRADSFFDTGNYDAILPIIRLVTWLDPHQIDVYATGMWHIGYNFTDEESRSDRRYIPSALALGKEGARQNSHTYEMFFETGWMWYHKIDDDYDKAVYWFQEAHERPDILPARKNLLANAYERNGEIEKALELRYKLLDDAQKRFDQDQAFQSRQLRDTIENNIDTLLVRMVQRGYFARKRKDGTAQSTTYDVNPPFDVGFSAKVTVEDPKVLRFEGTWNVLPVGTRIRTILRDADYPGARPAGMEWDSQTEVALDPPKDLTFMQDALFVKNRRFNRKADLSKDPTQYPFISDKYVIEFYYNPRSAAHHIQDKFSWNGEGMTDQHFLNTEIRPGARVIFARLELTRDQILRRKEWRDKIPDQSRPRRRNRHHPGPEPADGRADDAHPGAGRRARSAGQAESENPIRSRGGP